MQTRSEERGLQVELWARREGEEDEERVRKGRSVGLIPLMWAVNRITRLLLGVQGYRHTRNPVPNVIGQLNCV